MEKEVDGEEVESEIEKQVDVSEKSDLETTSDVIDDATDTVEESAEEEKGFFGEMWEEEAEEPEIDPNDPILNDPDLNPDL